MVPWMNWQWLVCSSLGAGFVVGGPIVPRAIAQITPDASLGAEQSTLTGVGTITIRGGATRGANLFHSFSNFNVPNNRGVYFANPVGVERIFSRVTGTTRSEILGTLGVLGNADLFLLNPNGILFGPNARLDVRGSFVASTANSILFSNGFGFSAVNPQAPPLLTVNVPIGLQYGNNPSGRIVSQGILVVNQGQSLVLAGGEIALDRSIMGVRVGQGGRVELTAISGEGTVGLNVNGDLWSLSVPAGLARADIGITNAALVQTLSRNGGSITVQARNLDVSGGSRLYAGIIGLGTGTRQAGDITLNATESIRVDGSRSEITNAVELNSVGQAGNVNITARSLSLTNGAQVGTTTLGRGSAGNLVINTSDRIVLESAPASGDTSGLFNTVAPQAVGNGGNTFITTGTLQLNNGGRISSSTFGQGNAGRIKLIVQNALVLDGVGGNRNFFSAVVSQVATPGRGNGGDIEITAKTFSLTNGAQLAASTFGQGNAGNVRVTVQEGVTIAGVGRNNVPSGIFSSLEKTGVGRGGDIQIQADSLLIANNGAGLFASTVGLGDSGQIRVQTTGDIGIVNGGRILATVEPGAVGNAKGIVLQGRSLSVSRGSQVSSNTFGQGNAGPLEITTTNAVTLAGQGSVISSRSGVISSNANNLENPSNDIGLGGDIRITTAQLQVQDQAILDAQTESRSRGGTITVNANIASVASGGQLRTTTFASGQSGDIILNVNDRITLTDPNSGLFANTEVGSTGKGGTIFMVPGSVMIRDRARISVDSQGKGEGGEIQIQTNSLRLSNQARITAETTSNIGGNIQIDVQDILLLRHNSSISTNAGTSRSSVAIGKGGNIITNAAFIVALSFENSDITANAFLGSGGNISIQTQGLFGIDFRPALTRFSDITASSEFGLAGNVAINTLGINPVQGTLTLPTLVSQPPLAQGCRASSQTSHFKDVGSGGMPTNPSDPIVTDAIWSDLKPIENAPEPQQAIPANIQTLKTHSKSIIEAQGWVVWPNGTVELTAEATTGLPRRLGNPAIACFPLVS